MATITNLKKPCIAFWVSAVTKYVAVLWISFAMVYSYEDLRGKPCRKKDAYSNIPKERAAWFGSVTINIECDDNYDFPLNVAENWTCIPDGSTWQPDYMPDCNEKILPKSVKLTIYNYISPATCSQLGNAERSDNMIVFSSGLKINITKKCEDTLIDTCSFVQAVVKCAAALAHRGSNASTIGEYSSHVTVLIKLAFSETIPWKRYTDVSKEMAHSIRLDLEPNATYTDVSVSLEPECQNGTVFVLHKGIEVVCRGCSLGHYMEERKCLPCRPGYYGDIPLSTACKKCPGINETVSSELWKIINLIVPHRAYDINGCPFLVRYPNGSVEVKMLGEIKKEPIAEVNKSRNSFDDSSNAAGIFLSMVIVVTVLSTLMAVIFLVMPRDCKMETFFME